MRYMMLSGPLSLPTCSRMRSPSQEPNFSASSVSRAAAARSTENEASRTQV